MKKHYLLTVLLTAVFLVFPVIIANAQSSAAPTASISGDDLCGKLAPGANPAANECNLNSFKSMVSSLLTLFITVGSILLVVFIIFRLVVSWFAFRTGDANAIKRAVNESWHATIGFFFVFALFGGLFIAILKSFGVQEMFLRLFSLGFVEHAYAATSVQPTMLPNPTVYNNATDLLLGIVRLIIRWFIYPAIVFMWVWSGFSYVAAQGKPDAIKKAHSYVMWAAIITIAVVTVQGFVFAVRGTVEGILPQARSSQTTPVVSGSQEPAPGTVGSACTTPSGTNGQLGLDKRCVSRSDSYNQVGTGSGRSAGVGEGGSCRIDLECTGTLLCKDGVCKSPYTVSPAPSGGGAPQTDFVITPR